MCSHTVQQESRKQFPPKFPFSIVLVNKLTKAFKIQFFELNIACLQWIVIKNVFAFILQEKPALPNIDESWSQLAADVHRVSSTDILR